MFLDNLDRNIVVVRRVMLPWHRSMLSPVSLKSQVLGTYLGILASRVELECR